MILNKPRRFITACLVVLAVVLMATVLSACGSSVKTYIDKSYGYSFSYPSGWKVQAGATSDATAGGSSAGTAAVYNPDGTTAGDVYVDLAMVMVYKLNTAVDDPWASATQTELEGLVTDLQSQATDMKVEQALAQTTNAGLKGYVATVTFTKDGTPMRSRLYFLFNGSIEYEVNQQAAIATWETTKPALDSIITTFKPGRAN
jgi:hypothetical protein